MERASISGWTLWDACPKITGWMWSSSVVDTSQVASNVWSHEKRSWNPLLIKRLVKSNDQMIDSVILDSCLFESKWVHHPSFIIEDSRCYLSYLKEDRFSIRLFKVTLIEWFLFTWASFPHDFLFFRFFFLVLSFKQVNLPIWSESVTHILSHMNFAVKDK